MQGHIIMLKAVAIVKYFTFSFMLLCAHVNLASADVVDIKSDAPSTYTVQKGDTLWDISNLFLDRPWMWPELWRNNVQIENPHLIYPGDILKLRYDAQGKPVLELERESERSKNSVVLTPNKRVVSKPHPIAVMPWSKLGPFMDNDSIVARDYYAELPRLLGDKFGSPVFSIEDFILSEELPETENGYMVVRKQREIVDSKGKVLGVQLTHISDAETSDRLSENRQLIRLKKSKQEARQGDRVMPAFVEDYTDLSLMAATTQVGEVVQNINGNVLTGQRDIVIINLGEDAVAPGMVFGIYHQGPNIKLDDKPKYVSEANESVLDYLSFKGEVEQPAFKVGELVVIKTFENASYAWVSRTDTHVRSGTLIARP